MKRIAIAAILVLASALPARAQGTPMPHPLIQWLDNAGLVFSDGGLCVFVAGTSTLATTYTTAALSVANSNPIEFDSAGRATSGGVFLTPGSTYKFVLKNFAGVVSPTCVPDTGVTIFTVDNVPAVPGSAAAVDATATAGESIAAGDAVFVSDGTGSLNAGMIYKMDADVTYRSTKARMVGIAPNAINTGTSGTFRIAGSVTLAGPLSPGAPYYASATAGGVTVTPPTSAIRLGVAQTSTVFVVGYTDAPVSPRGPPGGRLTLTSATCVTSADVTAATTVYYTPCGSNSIFLFDGTAWSEYAFAELSISVPATTNTLYDVYAYDNAGVVALELTAWTNDTTRATAIALQNGVYVKSGTTTRRYLGTFRTTGVSGQTEDSFAKRYVWNYYNRVTRGLRVIDTSNSWTYDSGTYRQANGVATNQVDVVVGVAEVLIQVKVVAMVSHNTGASAGVTIGEDVTNANTANTLIQYPTLPASVIVPLLAELEKYPAVGRHFYAWLESGGGATTTWYGDNGLPNNMQSGIQGWIQG